jgi:DNA-binding transcriptional MerR regulator
MPDEKSYTTKEVMQEAGVTLKNLHYWSDMGYITPSIHKAQGSGDPHKWSLDDIKRIRLIRARCDWGMTLDAAIREVDPPFPGSLGDL